MAGVEPERIKKGAKLGIIIYIDGYVAQIISMKPETNQQGIECWDFILEPSEELIKRYDIPPDKRNNDGFYRSIIPRTDIIILGLDPAWTRYLCLTNYEGKQGYATNILKGTEQQKEIEDLKRQVRDANMKVEVANESRQMIEMNIPKYMSRNVLPFIDALKPIIKEMSNIEKKD